MRYGWCLVTSTAHFTSKSNDWATPAKLMGQLDAMWGPFTLDPCASPGNAKAPLFYTPAEDGLKQSWAGHTVYMNPPYGRSIGLWVRKAFEESEGDEKCTVTCLIPSRTDTRYWHDYVMHSDQILFIKNRIYFGDGTGRAPFPSAIVRFTGGLRPRPYVDTWDMETDG